MWECPAYVPFELLEHLVRIALQLPRLQRLMQLLVVLRTVSVLVHVNTSAQVPELGTQPFRHALLDSCAKHLPLFI